MVKELTRNDIYAMVGANNVISIPNCELQNLLFFENRIGYNSGMYRWNYDVYLIDNICICTGDRPTLGVSVPWQLFKRYEKQARTLRKSLSDWTDLTKQTKDLLHEFVAEVKRDVLKKGGDLI